MKVSQGRKPKGYWEKHGGDKAKWAYYARLRRARKKAAAKGETPAPEKVVRRKFRTKTENPINDEIYQALCASGLILITDASDYRAGGDHAKAAACEGQGRKNLVLARKLMDQ